MCQCYFYRIGPEIMCTVFGEMFCKKMCFGENSKWQNIYIGKNGRGLCRVMCHGPRNPGKNNLDFTTYGSRVIIQTVKRAVIAPPCGRCGNFGAEVHRWHPG